MITTFTATLADKNQLTDHVYLFRFTHTNNEFEFKAGQYVILHIPQENGVTARRLYSMASKTTTKDSFELIVEIVASGVASEYLMALQMNDTMTVQGPAGMFILKPDDKDIIFLATGTGIAPIRSMIYDTINQYPQKKMRLFWGFPHVTDVYLFDEFMKLQQLNQNFTFLNCLSREENLDTILNPDQKKFCTKGHVNDAFEQIVTDDIMRYQYYVCGGPKVVDSLKEYLAGKNIPKEQIHFEKFTV